MNLIDFVFRLGVVFAIYGFLWGLIEAGIYILGGGRKRTLSEVYIFRAIKYFLLVNVTFLFSVDRLGSGMVVLSQVIFTGLILLTYFIGKLQKNQNQSALFKIMGNGVSRQDPTFSMKIELAIIILALGIFGLLWFFPEWAVNPISEWFHESIINIEDTPVFGFIFKVIGFFFLLSLIFKMISAFGIILGASPQSENPPFNRGTKDRNSDDDFDDYEEIT